ncbi:MAG: eukaryotic-like serine/threonine-protein kinase [Frankiaceae bacterium]|jgi:serine/threonine-protein kinase|nr:eukaryotic-like serine/threonine-protein kinase [Frankiaceae bacterium]
MDTTLSDPMVDRLLDGRYAVESRLARGGMASVYLATDTRLDRRVAVKVMHPGLAEDPDFVARFNREARASARLSHPDIVAVYDQGEDDGQAFLVMEYVPGATLREVLRDRGRLSTGEALAVMDHVLAALSAAHDAGLVHRDVKPENVLVTGDGRVKVADFGLARAVAGHNLTAADGALLGSPAYLAPEQVRDGTADARTDVYAAGIMLFELLTGRPPYAGEHALAVANRRLSEDVPAPSSFASGVPAEVDALVLAATAREPDERPADAGALHRSLVAVRNRLGLHAAVPTLPTAATTVLSAPRQDTLVVGPDAPASAPPAPSKKRRRRRRGLVALVVVLVLALVASAGGWYLAQERLTKTPSVLDLSRDAAVVKLRQAGLKVRWLAPVFSGTVPDGYVADERPGPGARVHKGASVSLALSRGPDHVPALRRLTVAQATAALRAAQLKLGDTTQAYSATVAVGHVIDSSPAAGAEIAPGTAVSLVVSKGPAPVTVPDVHGKPVGDATSILGKLGLQVTTTEVFSDTVPAGVVVSSSPGPGASLRVGATVNLVVSKGPQLFPVPDVSGMKIGQAIRVIEQAGFHADPRQAYPGGPGKVFRETPTGRQPKGTTIELDYF